MRQILQSLKTGDLELMDVPCPSLKAGHVLIRSRASLLSAGTERMMLDFGKANWLNKARQQPDKVKQTIDKIRTDGLFSTIEAIQAKLDKSIPLGYCNSGVVVETGNNVTGFSVGDRIASNCSHAEMVCAPVNLSSRIPGNVNDAQAAFTVVSAIGLNGIRLAQPTMGETFVVTGLGLIGQIVVQLLHAHGCRVLGIDPDPGKLEIARSFGVETVDVSRGEDPVAAALAFSRGVGVDGVIITASTKSNQPVHQAALMCRKRGRIVLTGVIGLQLSRADFYEKELSFQVSCSYGPGRYDAQYEQKGHDYPIGFVRWTEQRNFQAVLDAMASGALNVEALISHRFPFDEAHKAYQLLHSKEAYLGILFDYSTDSEHSINKLKSTNVLIEQTNNVAIEAKKPVVGMIGAGSYATRILLPALKDFKANLDAIVSSGGANAAQFGKKFGFREACSNAESIFQNQDINVAVIATQHGSHAQYVNQALKHGKHVFVEKPLCMTLEELQQIEESYNTEQLLMIGFNRRFSSFTQKMKSLLDSVREPKCFIMTVNAGDIPASHWTQDKKDGGGRIIGEACHFVDLLRFLAGSQISSFTVAKIGNSGSESILDDKSTITLAFEDGSMGTIHYLANGHKSFPKERLEVFCAGRVLQLDNFRKLQGFGWPGFSKMKSWKQDKGNLACMHSFLTAVQDGKPSPIPYSEIMEVSRVTIEIAQSLT